MELLRRAKESVAAVTGMASELPEFHPATVLRDWGKAGVFDVAAAKTGVAMLGATGSGKTSGPAKHLAWGYLGHGFGGLVLCAKPEEARQWQEWAAQTGRSADIIELNASGQYRYNFLAAEAARQSEGGGLTLNITALLSEVAGAVSRGTGSAEDGGSGEKFWSDALTHLLTNLIDLCVLSRQAVTLPRLRELATSAPLTMEQAGSETFRKNSDCCKAIMEAVKLAQGDEFTLVNVKECAAYFLQEWPGLSDKTRSIVQLTLSMLMRPFLTKPLYRIFSTDTNFSPEDAFDGKIIIVNLPVQTFKNAGIFSGILMKYVMQLAIMRRSEPGDGTYLRPVFIWSDEAQNFISDFDYTFQAVARSAGGCTCYIFQNRDTLLARLGNEHKVDSLLANLQAKFFCQNTGNTNEWASGLLGERWTSQISTSFNTNSPDQQGNRSTSGGASTNQQKRHYIEAAEFSTLARGGPQNGYQVQCIVYNGGKLFSDPRGSAELLPFALLTFNQR
jgi:hypothetical protein